MSTTTHKVVTHFELKEVWNSFSEQERRRVEETLTRTPEDVTSVLDVGCGDGRFLHLLASKINHAFGVDYCFEPLSRVRTPRAQADATRLPFKSDSFDLTVTTEMLEHLAPEQFTATLSELMRVSRKYVMLTVPYRENLREDLCRCALCKLTFHVYGHQRAFDKEDMYHLNNGLETVRIETIVPISKGHHLRLLYRLLHKIGRTYHWSSTTRCPACGGLPFSKKRTIAGYVIERIIWRINKHFSRIEDGWLVGLYLKKIENKL